MSCGLNLKFLACLVTLMVLAGEVSFGASFNAQARSTLPETVGEPVMVADINQKPVGLLPNAGSSPNFLTAVGDALFFIADDDIAGKEVWITIPPYTSARMVADVNPGNDGSQPHSITALGLQSSSAPMTAVAGRNCGRQSRHIMKAVHPGLLRSILLVIVLR